VCVCVGLCACHLSLCPLNVLGVRMSDAHLHSFKLFVQLLPFSTTLSPPAEAISEPCPWLSALPLFDPSLTQEAFAEPCQCPWLNLVSLFGPSLTRTKCSIPSSTPPIPLLIPDSFLSYPIPGLLLWLWSSWLLSCRSSALALCFLLMPHMLVLLIGPAFGCWPNVVLSSVRVLYCSSNNGIVLAICCWFLLIITKDPYLFGRKQLFIKIISHES